VPESILFLLKKGKVEETMCILKSIAQKNKKEEILENNQIILDKNVDDIDTTSSSKGINSKLMSHLFGPGRKKLTFLCWGICALGGFNYYGVVLFATEVMAKHEDDYTNHTSSESDVCHSLTSNDYASLLWTSLAEYPASLISLYIMDIIGRKKTFAINSGIYSLSLFLIMTVGKYFDATALTVLLFIARGSGVSYTWVGYIYLPEAYPTEVRSMAFGIANTFIRIGGMITPYVAQVLFEYSDTLAFGVYTLMGIIGTILPMFLPIETMGLDLSLSESKTLLDNDLKPSEGAYLKSKSES
jgi:MFS family permease